jgi:hypothetical protein
MQTGGNQGIAPTTKDLFSDSSSSDRVDEDLFIQNLVQLASSGELGTREEVVEIYLDTFGDDPGLSRLCLSIISLGDWLSALTLLLRPLSGEARCHDG